MRQIYFSHSYRDEDINRYFLDLFAEHEVQLLADLKSETWCVPKVERHVFGCDGLVAVVPERRDPESTDLYSPYIAQELLLARRAAIPCLIFVDDAIFGRWPDKPSKVFPFRRNQPKVDEREHRKIISQFCCRLEPNVTGGLRPSALRNVPVFVGDAPEQQEVAEVLEDILTARAYRPRRIVLDQSCDCLNDLSALGPVRAAEFSVFCTESRMTQIDLALAIAHALCRPAFRIRRDPEHSPLNPEDVKGWIRWATPDDLCPTFRAHVNSYGFGFLETVLKEENTQDLAGEIAEPEWDPVVPRSLVHFVHVGDPHLRTDLDAIRNRFRRGFPELLALGRHRELCGEAYQQIRSHNWLYDFEPGSPDYSRQRIRAPRDVHANQAGTCLDFACLFAALLENMQADPVVVHVLFTETSAAHALAGCWTSNRSRGAPIRGLADLRKAVDKNEVVLFETTGAARTSVSVAGENRCGAQTLSFEQAAGAARELLDRRDVKLGFLLDVLAARCQRS